MTLSLTTLSIMTFTIKGLFVTGIKGFFVTLGMSDTQLKKTVIMLSVAFSFLLC
jgi:hypothetical protein